MFVVKNKIIFFIVSGILVLTSLIALLVWGIKPGIEFTGGSIVEVTYPQGRPDQPVVQKALGGIGFADSSVRPAGENDYSIRTRYLSEADRATIISALSLGGSKPVTEKRVSSVGPIIGAELKSKAIAAFITVVLVTILFIAYAFRKVSEPIASWKYGVIAIIALLHDIIIPAGFFAFLGHFGHAEMDVLFITALLTAFGLSITDTIVVFDRIRENLRHNKDGGKKEGFSDLVGRSLNSTYVRSFNTSLTVILVLLSLFFIGGETTRYFALTLVIGMIAGTYSSIFIASPLLVVAKNLQDKNTDQDKKGKK